MMLIEWYERRCEEFHKGMKTGCNIEGLQFTTVERLGPAIALLSALAVTLLEMRDFSRMEEAETKPAEDVIDQAYVTVLSLWMHEFFYALARLDHPPGWLIIWRGWAKLQNLLIGYEAASRRRCGKTKLAKTSSREFVTHHGLHDFPSHADWFYLRQMALAALAVLRLTT